jgi:hypothetical protein
LQRTALLSGRLYFEPEHGTVAIEFLLLTFAGKIGFNVYIYI